MKQLIEVRALSELESVGGGTCWCACVTHSAAPSNRTVEFGWVDNREACADECESSGYIKMENCYDGPPVEAKQEPITPKTAALMKKLMIGLSEYKWWEAS